MKEFELIRRYFTDQPVTRKDVVMGIGDDCALIDNGGDSYVAITTDTLVAGVHFPKETSPRAIGHKAVAVNLSDLAAMGAVPSWISIAITLPAINEHWLQEFTQGIFELTEYYNVQLIGGDTTQGPLSITITAQGMVAKDKVLYRSGAKNGDYVFVTNTIGDAGLALAAINGDIHLSEKDFESVKRKLDFPKPQVLVAQMVREFATAAIDVSDGLLADLHHLCEASALGINLDLDNVPLSDVLVNNVSKEQALRLALTSGDDYQLIFTVSATNKVAVETAMTHAAVDYTCLGQLNPSKQINLFFEGEAFEVASNGFQHFS
ncbi:thiamine-phosphate kinase [Thalassotalea ponticola]|uniref:thiamine-phosphate kinase n=1 Tax=Thalassotalea ponticola TaxID=1523392 RepID=UPI0025B55AE5|nr:thiamine-phosphate kinase [Thalassotalea ponticola]MDN3651660.1 thiamine-phosphate kinase [Thalassotalea ponticola]